MSMAFLTSFISSKLIVLCTNHLGLSSTPGAPLSGVLVSLKKALVAMNITTSTNVLHITCNTNQMYDTNLMNLPELLDRCLFFVGIVGNAFRSDVFRVQARTSDMIDMPSPIEWWIRKIAVDSASEVLTLRRWISHKGFESSR